MKSRRHQSQHRHRRMDRVVIHPRAPSRKSTLTRMVPYGWTKFHVLESRGAHAREACEGRMSNWRLHTALSFVTGGWRAQGISHGTMSIRLYDLRPRRRKAEDLRPVLREALRWIATAGSGFPELVSDHLKTIVAADVPSDRVLHRLQAYLTRFDAPKNDDARFLATQLVWVATSSRLARDQEAHRDNPDTSAIAAAARAAQLRFVQRFPDWERWADSLRLPP